MSLETIIEMSFIAIFAGGLGTLFWARMNRFEAQIIDIRSAMATREDLGRLEAQIIDIRSAMTTRVDLAEFRTEMKDDMSALRQEFAVMRSDLTHVALAVGVNRPKPAEG